MELVLKLELELGMKTKMKMKMEFKLKLETIWQLKECGMNFLVFATRHFRLVFIFAARGFAFC